MIVGTEGTTVDTPDQDQGDPTAGKGYARNEGETEPPDPAQSPDQAPPAGQGKKGGQGGGDADQDSSSKKPDKNAPAPTKDEDPRTLIAKGLAVAEAMKPLEPLATDLNDPVKQKAVKDAYAKAIGDNGDLSLKLNDARKKFDRAAADMKPHVEGWLKLLEKDQLIGKLLQERKDLNDKITAKLGDKEKARLAAQDDAKAWADANANWASPAEKMSAMIGQYADKIDKLNADINNEVSPNAAMLSFWFEVAPKHLQIDDKNLSADAAAVVAQVSGKLAAYNLDKLLMKGEERNDGSLYVIPADKLTDKRLDVFKSWKAAATAVATADSDFKLNPDDVASEKQRFDKLKDDAWLQEAKKQPLDPTTPA